MLKIGEEDFRFEANVYIQSLIKAEIQSEIETKTRKESAKLHNQRTGSVESL